MHKVLISFIMIFIATIFAYEEVKACSPEKWPSVESYYVAIDNASPWKQNFKGYCYFCNKKIKGTYQEIENHFYHHIKINHDSTSFSILRKEKKQYLKISYALKDLPCTVQNHSQELEYLEVFVGDQMQEFCGICKKDIEIKSHDNFFTLLNFENVLKRESLLNHVYKEHGSIDHIQEVYYEKERYLRIYYWPKNS